MVTNFREMFLRGCLELVAADFAELQTRGVAGRLSKSQWELATQREKWTESEAIASVSALQALLAQVMTASGLPPMQMPAAYVAGMICMLVAPCNRMVAATNAPRAFDVEAASGLHREIEIKETPREHMVAMVTFLTLDPHFLAAMPGIADDQVVVDQLRQDVAKRMAKSEQV